MLNNPTPALDQISSAIDSKALITIETPAQSYQNRKSYRDYWVGYRGLVVGAFVFSIPATLFVTAISVLLFAFTLLLVPFLITGWVSVVGLIVFWVWGKINESLKWPLPSRYAAFCAAGLTGFLAILPWLLAVSYFQVNSVVSIPIQSTLYAIPLMIFLEVGAWLAMDKEMRRFQNHFMVSKTGLQLDKEHFRFEIRTLLIGMFWLAGTFAIFKTIDSYEVDVVAVFIIPMLLSLFLSAGFAAIGVGLIRIFVMTIMSLVNILFKMVKRISRIR